MGWNKIELTLDGFICVFAIAVAVSVIIVTICMAFE